MSGSPASIGVDPATSAVGVSSVCNYTVITTAGTTTVGNAAGVFFGAVQTALGTGETISVYDGTNVLLGTSTYTAVNQLFSPTQGSVAVRFTNDLIVITGGTAGTVNVYWD